MLYKKVQSLFHPERYHGWGRSRNYFEGWYYKLISADEKHALAIIPGIAMDNQGNRQAFIQVLDGKKQNAEYHQFLFETFVSESGMFKTTILGNKFEMSSLTLDLPNLTGELRFTKQTPWPNQWYSPGIMGPFAFVPFMECYHGILSLDHSILGELTLNNEQINFTGGRGYIEKDWGHSFPSAYIWLQSNHFSEHCISLKVSVAKIPWLTSSFVGFIAGLYFNEQLIEFTTYNGSHIVKSNVTKDEVEIILKNKKYRLEVRVQRSTSTELASPIQGFMDGRISESMTSLVKAKLINEKSGEVLFKDIGRNAGLEVAGNIPEILVFKD